MSCCNRTFKLWCCYPRKYLQISPSYFWQDTADTVDEPFEIHSVNKKIIIIRMYVEHAHPTFVSYYIRNFENNTKEINLSFFIPRK